jgi:hypothetical protein
MDLDEPTMLEACHGVLQRAPLEARVRRKPSDRGPAAQLVIDVLQQRQQRGFLFGVEIVARPDRAHQVETTHAAPSHERDALDAATAGRSP